MKTGTQLQAEIVEINKAINKINLIQNSRDLFGTPLFNDQERADLERLKETKISHRDRVSHAKRLIARLERIQRLEADDRSLEQIAIEWRDHAEDMKIKQEIRVKSRVQGIVERNQEIRESTAHYNQEIETINYILEWKE